MTTTASIEHAPNTEELAYYELNQKAYRWFAPFYDLVTSPFLAELRQLVAKLARVHPGERVIDVATGTGAQALAYAKIGANVLGVDISDSMLRIARRKRQRENLHFARGDGTKLDFPDAKFDLSSISFALHEMPGTVRSRVLGEMSRVTKPAGTVVIVDYGLPKDPKWDWLSFHLVKLYERDHYAQFVRSDWHALLETAAIRVQEDHALLRGNARVVIGRAQGRA